MKPRIFLRLIVSLLLVAAFVLGATILEANNRLNVTAWWWAQRELPVLWIADGFALLALIPIFSAASLQTRLAHKSEELTAMREHHDNQMRDTLRHTEETERINAHHSENIEALEAATVALHARIDALEAERWKQQQAMEAANKAHQQQMEAEMRRVASDAFAALANEVQANTRQMEAVNLAMQYQRAEIKQLRQSIRIAQHSQEVADIARLTPYELAALQEENPPLLLEEGESETEEEAGHGVKSFSSYKDSTDLLRETGEKGEQRAKEQTADIQPEVLSATDSSLDSSFVFHPASLYEPATDSAGFFEPTMNAQNTFVSPTTELEIAPVEFPLSLSAENAPETPLTIASHDATIAAELREVQEDTPHASMPEEKTTQSPSEEAETRLIENTHEVIQPEPHSSDNALPLSHADAVDVSSSAPDTRMTVAEYEALHTPAPEVPQDSAASTTPAEPPADSPQTEATQDASQEAPAPHGLRRWFMRL